MQDFGSRSEKEGSWRALFARAERGAIGRAGSEAEGGVPALGAVVGSADGGGVMGTEAEIGGEAASGAPVGTLPRIDGKSGGIFFAVAAHLSNWPFAWLSRAWSVTRYNKSSKEVYLFASALPFTQRSTVISPLYS